jgi:hypothetical protein
MIFIIISEKIDIMYQGLIFALLYIFKKAILLRKAQKSVGGVTQLSAALRYSYEPNDWWGDVQHIY